VTAPFFSLGGAARFPKLASASVLRLTFAAGVVNAAPPTVADISLTFRWQRMLQDGDAGK
jgi:hypothetical protein